MRACVRACVCVCVCARARVCVRERERERGQRRMTADEKEQAVKNKETALS